MPFSDHQHQSDYRVYYEDTDAGGIVYHANYMKFAERARSDAMRELGYDQKKMRDDLGILFVIRHAEISYLKPVQLDDLVTVRSRIIEFGNSSLKMQQDVWRDSLELCRMLMHIVCISDTFRPVRIPEEIRIALSETMMPKEA